MLFSEKFQIEKDTIEKYGAIDISLVCDIPLFIDPMLIFNSNKPVYRDLHKSIIKYFHFLAKKSEQKLELADIKNWFTFKEVCNNWFGYALEGNKGSALDIEFGKFLYNNIKFVLKTNDIPSGEHAEKIMLLYEGSGRDKISDMTVNLIKGFLCEYTQTFAKKYLKESNCAIFPVEKAEFNYETESFITKEYYLPFIINEKGEDEFILLTPLDILRKNEPSLNRDHFLKNNRKVRDHIENDVLKAQVNNYIAKAVAAYEKEQQRNKKKPREGSIRKIEREAFAEIVKEHPEIYDYYIKMREEEKEILQEEKARKRKGKKAEKRKVRTGGFVDEIDEDDITEHSSGKKASAMQQTAQTAASEAHEELKKEIAAATSEEADMAPEFERTQRRPAERKTARPQPRRTEEPERVEEEQVTIGSLAMPSLSAAQLASRVKQAGDAPDIVKDDITNVTLFDYSDIIGSDTDATEE